MKTPKSENLKTPSVTAGNQALRMPKWLHELHGERSNWPDIAAVHVVAWTLGISIFWLEGGLAGALLAFLMIDIAGGVVANVTRGTNDYYAQRPRHRTVFLSLHVIQPLLLIVFLSPPVVPVALVTGWTLFGAVLLETLRRRGHERTLSAPIATAWAVCGIAGLVMAGGMDQGIELLLILYMLKLLPSFSVDWYCADRHVGCRPLSA